MDAAHARRADHRRLHARPAWSWRAGSGCTIELGIAVAGFFDDRGSDRLGCSRHAQLLGRFGDVLAFVNRRNIDVIFIAIPPGQVPRMRELVHELGDTTASIYFVPDVSGFDMIQQRASEILGFPVVAMCETPFHGYRGLVKRLMDVTHRGGRADRADLAIVVRHRVGGETQLAGPGAVPAAALRPRWPRNPWSTNSAP